jgi:hypothetical protein
VKAEDLSGRVFGRWTVLRRGPPDARNQIQYVARCECGNVRTVSAGHLRHGKSTACQECRIKHGHSVRGKLTSEYRIWCGMIQRCTNPNVKAFGRYGGRGIRVCDEWRNSFETFLAHVGPRPSTDYSIDRYPNKDGNYEPGNVRWATQSEQCLNKSHPKRGTYKNA